MSLPTEARFERLFRGLDDAERVAFVAALWSARGWTTTVDGSDVVAARDGEELCIRVVDPGRFGTPTLEGADVLATARDRAAVRRTAESAGVRYEPPARLFGQLKYAVDRETAERLFESTFGEPFDATESHVAPSITERIRGLGAATRRTLPDGPGTSRAVTSVLLVLIVLGVVVAGPVSMPGSSGGAPELAETGPFGTETAGPLGVSTASPTATTSAAGFPPGVDESGITDLSRLLVAHDDGVSGRQRTLSVAGSGPPDAKFMDGRLAWNYTLRVERSSHYRFDANYTYPPGVVSQNSSTADAVSISVFAGGGDNYRRRTDSTGTSYQRYPTEAAGPAWTFTDEVRSYLRYFLGGERTRVDCSGANAGDAVGATVGNADEDACRFVVTGAPATLSNASHYRATATVTRAGVVRSLAVRYTLPDDDGDDEREIVRFWLTYESMDDTTVSEPDWLPAAKNATSEPSSG